MSNVSDKIVQKIITHILFVKYIFPNIIPFTR